MVYNVRKGKKYYRTNSSPGLGGGGLPLPGGGRGGSLLLWCRGTGGAMESGWESALDTGGGGGLLPLDPPDLGMGGTPWNEISVVSATVTGLNKTCILLHHFTNKFNSLSLDLTGISNIFDFMNCYT